MRAFKFYFSIVLLSSFLSACNLPFTTKEAEPPKPAPTPKPATKVIKAPVIPKKTVPVKKVEPKVVKKICGLAIQPKQRKSKSEQLYLKADRLFAKDAIKSAKQNLKKAVCLNPKHAKAKELLQLLEETYP